MNAPNPLATLGDYADDTVARAMAAAMPDLAYTPGMGWLVWTGHLWQRDESGVLVARQVADFMRAHVPDVLMAVGTAQRRQAVALLSQSKMETLTRALRALLVVPVDAWDADPWTLNTPAGLVDLRTGDLRPPDRAARATRSTSVPYVAGATSAAWEQALECQPEIDERAWLQAYLGSGCLGLQRGDTLALLTGQGSNGKSTVLSAVVAALGTYAAPVDRSVIVGEGHGEHRAALRGLRLGLIEELADGHRLNMAEVKALVGTTEVTARHLYQPAMRFRMQATLCVTTNYPPVVSDTDHGTWRRVERLVFPMRYEPVEGQAPEDDLRWRCQHDHDAQVAVLAWLVEGARMPMPKPTKAMLAAKEEWRGEVDTVAAFIADHVLADPLAFTTRGDLYEAFVAYAASQGGRQWTSRTFHQRWASHAYVEAMGATDHKRAGERGWLGLRLEPSPSGAGHPF